ncbi:hypothetical protein [Arcobacter sp. s6]|jgi:hypothetical protein|uniref:hypothetical protein n=1 Tax=Arcobacter sp. s6 TaxID=3230363 RepID=UPI0034A03F9A
MINYISTEEIFSLELDVSEEIDNNSLKNFVLTSLNLNNKEYSSTDLIYATYLQELKQYQVILINNQSSKAEFQVFELFYDDISEGLDLYLTDEFFCLYKNGVFYYYQAIEFSLTIEEFLDFINKKFNTKVNNYKRIQKEELEELKNKYSQKNKKSNLKNINKKKDNSFIFYIIYLFLLIYICIYYIEQNNSQKTENPIIQNQSINYEKFKKEHTFISLENDFNGILENIKKYSLQIISFEYKKPKIKIILNSQIKANLYLFLKEYKKSLISSSIYFDEKKELYEVTAYVNLYK